MSDPTEYELCWPPGYPRTDYEDREEGRWRYQKGPSGRKRFLTIVEGRDSLLESLRRFGAQHVTISTDADRNRDGSISGQQRRSTDPGVAVYFKLNGREMVIAQDQFLEIECNMRSLALCFEGMIQMRNHGGGPIFNRIEKAFTALPGPMTTPRDWPEILKLPRSATRAEIKSRKRELSRVLHPDAGGDAEAFKEMTAAADQALREVSA